MRTDHGGSGGTNGTEAELSDSLKTFGAVLKALREESGLTPGGVRAAGTVLGRVRGQDRAGEAVPAGGSARAG